MESSIEKNKKLVEYFVSALNARRLDLLDELMTPDQARAIRKNAEVRCPKDASRLCKAISDRIIAMGPLGRRARRPPSP